MFSCIKSCIDDQGRYIFLFCSIENRPYILANTYIPPPFKFEVLYRLLEFTTDKTGVPVIAVGDYNEVLDRSLDRFPPGNKSTTLSEGRLARFLEEIGLRDIWRTCNPRTRQYSCYSSSYRTLSRIDMAVGSEEILPLVKGVEYGLKGVSDHSPLVLTIKIGVKAPRNEWKINPGWLELIGDSGDLVPSLKEYLQINTGSAPTGVVWDSLKAFLRGLLIQQVARVKREGREREGKLGLEAAQAEARFIEEPTLTRQKESSWSIKRLS